MKVVAQMGKLFMVDTVGGERLFTIGLILDWEEKKILKRDINLTSVLRFPNAWEPPTISEKEQEKILSFVKES